MFGQAFFLVASPKTRGTRTNDEKRTRKKHASQVPNVCATRFWIVVIGGNRSKFVAWAYLILSIVYIWSNSCNFQRWHQFSKLVERPLLVTLWPSKFDGEIAKSERQCTWKKWDKAFSFHPTARTIVKNHRLSSTAFPYHCCVRGFRSIHLPPGSLVLMEC